MLKVRLCAFFYKKTPFSYKAYQRNFCLFQRQDPFLSQNGVNNVFLLIFFLFSRANSLRDFFFLLFHAYLTDHERVDLLSIPHQLC